MLKDVIQGEEIDTRWKLGFISRSKSTGNGKWVGK